MRVDWVVLCRYVEVVNGLVTIVGGGLDSFLVAGLPVNVSLTAAVRIVGWPDPASHAIAVRVLDPAMSELSNKLEGTFTMEPHANHPPGWESAVHLSMVVQFEAVEAGTYGFDLSVDGLSHTMPFRIELVASSPD